MKYCNMLKDFRSKLRPLRPFLVNSQTMQFYPQFSRQKISSEPLSIFNSLPGFRPAPVLSSILKKSQGCLLNHPALHHTVIKWFLCYSSTMATSSPSCFFLTTLEYGVLNTIMARATACHLLPFSHISSHPFLFTKICCDRKLSDSVTGSPKICTPAFIVHTSSSWKGKKGDSSWV